jgi:hypothetical protein
VTTGSLRVVDHGAQKLFRVLRARQPVLKVGMFGSAAEAVHGDGSSAATVADVMGWLEFGTDNAPSRSWLRAYVDENLDRITKMLQVGATAIYQGKETPESFLQKLGVQIKGEIQARISAGLSPANAASTIRRKGSSKPGIDTGQGRAAIASQVVSR